MITVKTKIPSNINEDLAFIESISDDKSFLNLVNPNDKKQSLKKAQWNCVTGEIEGVIDE